MIKLCRPFAENIDTLLNLTLNKLKSGSVHNDCVALTHRVLTRGARRGQGVSRFSLKSKQIFTPDPVEHPRLSPQQVTSILRMNENSVAVENDHAIKAFEVNKLPANTPIEDRDCQAKLKFNTSDGSGTGYLFGVYDGHGGYGCSQALLERLFNYISVTMSPVDVLEEIRKGHFNLNNILDWHSNYSNYCSEEMAGLHKSSLSKLASEILAVYEEATVEEHLINAFTRLDQDMSMESAVSSWNEMKQEALQVSFSGSCACVVYIEGTDVYVANVGDSRAVLGVNVDDGVWKAVELSNPHIADNKAEVRRILNAHPNESSNVIKGGRLFGDLAPLRTFGNVRYKWSAKELERIMHAPNYHSSLIGMFGDRLIPNNYNTPPYLTAEPEVIHHSLTPKDKFLVLASDGLWDMLTPEKVVQLVAGHMDGKQVLVNSHIDHTKMNLKQMNELLKRRKASLANRTVDDNVATHLIRNALGPDHGHVSALISLPGGIARLYRDDITVIVVYFDSDYVVNAFTLQNIKPE